MSSWWVCDEEEFKKRLTEEQKRMKRELEPKSLKRVYEKLQQLEEKELRGIATGRNPVAPKDHEILFEGFTEIEDDREEETGS